MVEKYLKYIYQPGLMKSTFLSIIFLIFIWWIAPYFTFAGYTPFLYLPLKIFLTVLLVLFWVFRGLPYVLFYYKRLQSNFRAFRKKTILHSKEKKVLQHFSKKISRCLIELSRGKYPFLVLDKRPWILVLGSEGVGKSQLFKKAEIGLEKTSFPDIGLFIWQNDKHVFFELSGDYVASNHVLLELQWKRFLSLIQRYHEEKFLSSIMLIMDVNLLATIHSNKGEDFIGAVKARLDAMQQFNYFVPMTVTITKCDLLEGFIPFFSELTQSERRQRLGIELTDSSPIYLIQDQFIEQYASFIQMINSRLIWLFRHEPNLQKRQSMQKLIAELEVIELILEKIFISIKWGKINSPVRGIFFTSNEQKAKEKLISLIQSQNIPKSFFRETETQQTIRTQVFFSNDLLEHIVVFGKGDYHSQIKTLRRRVIFFIVTLFCVFLLTFVIQKEYKQVNTKLSAINAMLRSKPVEQVMTSSNWQDQLNALYDIDANIHSQAKFRFRGIEWLELLPVAYKAQQLYKNGLAQLFMPELEKTIFLDMQRLIQSKSIDLYFALKVYLMLTNVHHLDEAFVYQWFFSVWSEQYGAAFEQQNNLLKHLKYLLKAHLLPLSVNQAIVNKIRQDLLTLPRANLIFSVLTDNYTKNSVLLFKNQKNIAGFELNRLTIPAFYDPKQFKTIYNQLIPHFLKNDNTGNWVTGKIPNVKMSKAELSRLIDNVRSLYLKSYARNWLNILNQINFKPINSLTELRSALGLLRNSNSPFWQFIKVILFNAMLSENNSQYLGEPYNSLYIQLSSLAAKDESYQNMQMNLKTFDDYLAAILNASDPKKSSYQNAVHRMQNNQSNDILNEIGKGMTNLPLSFQRILHQFSIQAWQIILNQAAQYLDRQWKVLVWKPYSEVLDNRYPLFAQSKTDIPFDEFQKFFSPKGTINYFFEYYIRPFVNTKKNYWVWQRLDGLSLPLPQTTLDIFIRAALIEKMFFADNPNQISFKFSILPLEISPTIAKCIINIGGQVMSIEPNNLTPHQFTWSSSQKQGASVTLKYHTGQQEILLIQQDPWGWFRILNSAELKTTEDPKEYQLTFQKGQYVIRLKVTTPHLINPYVPNILQAFRCPKSLW